MTQATENTGRAANTGLPSGRRRFDVSTLVWTSVVVILIILIANPVFYLIKQSFILAEEEGSGWTLGNFVTAFTEPENTNPIFWTLVISVLVGVFGLIVGAVMAWCVSRTDIPFSGFIRNAVLMSFVTPPFLGAIAWIFLAGPRQGWVNIIYRAIMGTGPDDYLRSRNRLARRGHHGILSTTHPDQPSTPRVLPIYFGGCRNLA